MEPSPRPPDWTARAASRSEANAAQLEARQGKERRPSGVENTVKEEAEQCGKVHALTGERRESAAKTAEAVQIGRCGQLDAATKAPAPQPRCRPIESRHRRVRGCGPAILASVFQTKSANQLSCLRRGEERAIDPNALLLQSLQNFSCCCDCGNLLIHAKPYKVQMLYRITARHRRHYAFSQERFLAFRFPMMA